MSDNINKFLAIIREIPDSFKNCITTQENISPINVEKARMQHHRYCSILKSLGLQLIRIEADENLPDCCFTEDTVIVLNELAIVANPMERSRKGESEEIVKILRPLRKLFHLKEPAYLDGGDVIVIGKRIFIGLSARTNQKAIDQVEEWVKDFGYEVRGVPVQRTLHLKSACTYIGNGTMLLSPTDVDPLIFKEYSIIEVPASERYCADALIVNNTVLIPEGYPQTEKRIKDHGFELITLDTSEIKKADGALTCMSVVLSA